MNERLKQIRLEEGVSQEKFADRLGVSGNYIYLMESGKKDPSDRLLRDICREFGVDEVWLRTGEGAMRKKLSRDEEIAAFIGDTLAGPDDFKKRMISALARLSVEEWELLAGIAQKMADGNSKA